MPAEPGFNPTLGGAVPLDLTFTDESGREGPLGAYFEARPVLLLFGYYQCRTLCRAEFDRLAAGLGGVDLSLGTDYEVLAVSIDPRETPAQAAARKAELAAVHPVEGMGPGWSFLTGSRQAIERLTEAAGFAYQYDPAQDEFTHPLGVLALTPDGRIARYLSGPDLPALDLQLALVEAGEGEIGTIVDRALLLCFSYLPGDGRYEVAILNLFRLAGVLASLALGAMVWTMASHELGPIPAGEGPREGQ